MRLGDEIAEILEQIKRGDVQNIDIEKARRLFNQADEVVQKASGWMIDADEDPHFSKMYARLAEFMQGKAGLRLANPPLLYDGEYWHLVGTDDTDTLQVGINAASGKLTAGQGAVILDEDGITIQADETTPWITFKDENGTTVATIFQDGAGNLQHDLAVADQLFTFNDGAVVSSQHNSKIPAFAMHYGYAEKGVLFWSPADSHVSLKNSTANGSIYFNVEGSGGGDGIRLWDADAAEIVWKVNQNGAMHLKALGTKPSYVDGWAILYLYSDGAGDDVVQLRTKIGATETETTLQNVTP